MNPEQLKNQRRADVARIIDRVIKQGDRALVAFTKKFDRITLSPARLRITGAERARTEKQVSAELSAAIRRAADNVARFHREELRRLPRSWETTRNGIATGERIRPVERVGIYVPGGRFPYPSTVLMTAIPARVAGVRSVVMVTPPKNITPAVLYAARCAGVNDIFRVGGPAAIAALAYGTKSIGKVDLIVGPGNAYVNEAKRQVIGAVGIDSLAGPSEVAIIADSGAKPAHIVADLCAQAEHDPDARARLFTDSAALAARVRMLVGKGMSRQITVEVMPLARAVAAANALAPERLQLMVRNARRWLGSITNAGAVFVGYGTPTALGDYWAGPSHVLPTGGTARFSSGLSVATFVKRTSVVSCTAEALRRDGNAVRRIAEAEGLTFHGLSVYSRT